jgi:hypothetical protein
MKENYSISLEYSFLKNLLFCLDSQGAGLLRIVICK